MYCLQANINLHFDSISVKRRSRSKGVAAIGTSLGLFPQVSTWRKRPSDVAIDREFSVFFSGLLSNDTIILLNYINRKKPFQLYMFKYLLFLRSITNCFHHLHRWFIVLIQSFLNRKQHLLSFQYHIHRCKQLPICTILIHLVGWRALQTPDCGWDNV